MVRGCQPNVERGRSGQGVQVIRPSGATGWALACYVVMPAASVLFGEAVLFVWPHLPMLRLGVESVVGFAAMLLFGAVSILVSGWWLSRLRPKWAAFGFIRSIALGLALAVGTVSTLVALAWCFALALGKATAA